MAKALCKIKNRERFLVACRDPECRQKNYQKYVQLSQEVEEEKRKYDRQDL